VLVERGVHEAGVFTTIWNGRDLRGRELSSGIYFVHMVAGDYQTTRKVTMLR